MFLLLICLVVILGILKVYNPMLVLFSKYAESEIQTYFFIFFTTFISSALFYWLSFKKEFSSRLFLRGNINIKFNRLFFLPLFIIQIVCLFYFVMKGRLSTLFIWELHTTGLFTDNNFKINTYIIIALLLLLAYFLLIFSKSLIKKAGIAYYILSFLLIAIISISFENLNFYDYAYYAGPINDLLHGKYLLHNNISQYGFLSIVFLSIPFYFIKLNLTNLTVLNSFAITIGFFALFTIANSLYRNKYFSLLVLLFIIFANHITAGYGSYVQTNVLRFGMWIPVCLSIICGIKNKGSKLSGLWEAITLILIAISAFWIFDNGVYILLAYFFYRIFASLDENPRNTFNSFKEILIKLTVSVGVVFLSINIFYIVFLKIMPDWNYYISDSVYYLHGFGLMAFPNSSWPWFFILTYIISLCLLFTQKRFFSGKERSVENSTFSFILFYGIFQFAYFMGRSHLNNLHHVFVPFALSLFYIILVFIRYTRQLSDNLIKILIGIMISLGLALPFYFLYSSGVKNIKFDNLLHLPSFIRSVSISEKLRLGSEFEETVNILKNNSGNEYSKYIKLNGITLLSILDTWYLIELNMVNNIESNNLHHYIDDKEMKVLARSVLKRTDKYIFVDKDRTKEGSKVDFLYKILANEYKFRQNIGGLDVYEKIKP